VKTVGDVVSSPVLLKPLVMGTYHQRFVNRTGGDRGNHGFENFICSLVKMNGGIANFVLKLLFKAQFRA
jgi:hypothetical protein